MLYRICVTSFIIMIFFTRYAYALYVYSIDPTEAITLVSYDNTAYIMPRAALEHSKMLGNALHYQERFPQLISPLHHKILDCTSVDITAKRTDWYGSLVMRSVVYSHVIALPDLREEQLSKLCALLMTLEGMRNRDLTPAEQVDIIARKIASQQSFFLTSLGLAGLCEIPQLDNAISHLVQKCVAQYGIRMLDAHIACTQSITSQALATITHFEASGLRHFKQFLAHQKAAAKKDCLHATNTSGLAPYVRELSLQDFIKEKKISLLEHNVRSNLLIGNTAEPFEGRQLRYVLDDTNLSEKSITLDGLERLEGAHEICLLRIGQQPQSTNPFPFICTPKPFIALQNIQTIELVEQPQINLIATFPAPLDNIQILALLDNNQVIVSANALLNLPHLRTLYIQGTEQLTLTDNMCLPSTQLVAVTNNHSLQLAPEVRWIAPHLVLLNLSDNNLQSLPRHITSDLISLRTLILNNNQLRSFDEATLGNLSPQLHIIELENNALTKVATSACKKLTSLKHLTLKGNSLSEEKIKKIKKRLGHVQITVE